MVGQYAYYGNVTYEEDLRTDGNIGTFTLAGAADLMAKLENQIAIMPEVVMDRLELHAEKILSMSKEEVPWDTTHLMQTGTIEPFEDSGLVGYQIGYNATSGTTKYANIPAPGFSGSFSVSTDYNYGLRQHEDLTLYHPKPGRKAKFLEDPFNRHKDQVIPEIVSYVDNLYQAGVPDMSSMMRSRRSALGNLGGRFV